MRGKRLGYAGIGAGVLALVVAGCVDPNTPTLTGVTMAPTGCDTANGGFAGCSMWDSVTFTFYGPLPATSTAAYVGATAPAGPSGHPAAVDGVRFVSVALTPAVAHDTRGASTAQGAVYAAGMHKIAETATVEDFEGHVRYVIGLKGTSAPALLTVRSGKTFTVLVG